MNDNDYNLIFDKKTDNIFKQDSKPKSKRNKINSIDQEYIFKKKNKNRLIIHSENNLHNQLEVSLQSKSNKQRKKDKTNKQKSNTGIDNNQINQDTVINNNLDLIHGYKSVVINNLLTVEQLAMKLDIPSAEIITSLFLQGIPVTVNQIIDIFTATQVAQKYNFKVIDQNYQTKLEKSNKLQAVNSSRSINRAPIVTILGHVDHGKTTLLDAIRNTDVINQEIGGITQAITAYEVNWSHDKEYTKLIFIDTPGHKAFSSMRLRCAQITDIVILIVAADDGLKPQTIEVIDYIIANKLPCIVAINKIDKTDINIYKIKEELAKHNLVNIEWGGEIQFVEVSAIKKINIDKLFTAVCKLLKCLDLKADPTQPAEGIVLEAYLDRSKGIVVNLIILNGNLNVGDIIVSDKSYGRVKKLVNNLGIEVIKANISSIIEVLGFYSIPQTGKYFNVVHSEKEAKNLIQKNKLFNKSQNTHNLLSSNLKSYNYNTKKYTKILNLIIKADTQGTIDALFNLLTQIPQSKVQLNVLNVGLGVISNTDLDLAFSTQALIVAFNTNIPNNTLNKAKKLSINICKFVIIYDFLEYIQDYMLNLIDPEYNKILIGEAIVQTIFSVNKGVAAGCIVRSGKLKKNALINIYRNNQFIHEGVISSLKQLKDDVDEVVINNECGIMCKDYTLWEANDIIKAYELYEKSKVL
uniref:translation initiation factor 2 n=1 Tax=Gracilaria urvillei TaxID=172974 RepID=UPI001D11267F|nr:translation initiation factor 2 [Hydropuntia urvillei]UAD88442.1 translation initiation factor 2 [Hydropuntia urvillei]